MAFFVEETKEFTTYKAVGFFAFQDIQALIHHFDDLVVSNPNARVLLDFTEQNGYEEANIKYAFQRIDKGFPKGVRLALLYESKGMPFHVLQFIAKAMPANAKFFAERDEAIGWLKS